MNWNQKIASQLYEGNERYLPNLPDSCQTQEHEEWLQKKMCASKQEILETMQFMHNTEDSDEESRDSMHCSEEEGEPYSSGNKSSSRNVNDVMLSRDNVCLFLYQLQYNVCFDMGFKVTTGASLDKKRCYCPCSKHMEPWREKFFLNGIAGKGSKTFCEPSKGSKNMFPSGLLQHRKDVNTCMCPFYYGIHSYVSTLHAAYISSKGTKTNYEVEVEAKSHTNTEQQSVVECTPKMNKNRP